MAYELEHSAPGDAGIDICCDALGAAVNADVVKVFIHEEGARLLDSGYFAFAKRPRRPKGMPREEWEESKPAEPRVLWSAHLTRHRDPSCCHDYDTGDDYPVSAEPLRFCPFCGTEISLYLYSSNHTLTMWEMKNNEGPFKRGK